MSDITALLKKKEDIELQIKQLRSKTNLSEYEKAVLEDMLYVLSQTNEQISKF